MRGSGGFRRAEFQFRPENRKRKRPCQLATQRHPPTVCSNHSPAASRAETFGRTPYDPQHVLYPFHGFPLLHHRLDE